MTRSLQAQGEHDLVIARVAKQLAEKYRSVDVYANPGPERNLELNGCWPDIVLMDRLGVPRAVYEVETADTVVLEHARPQWCDYARLAVPFYLVVPTRSRGETIALVRSLGIRVEKLILY